MKTFWSLEVALLAATEVFRSPRLTLLRYDMILGHSNFLQAFAAKQSNYGEYQKISTKNIAEV